MGVVNVKYIKDGKELVLITQSGSRKDAREELVGRLCNGTLATPVFMGTSEHDGNKTHVLQMKSMDLSGVFIQFEVYKFDLENRGYRQHELKMSLSGE